MRTSININDNNLSEVVQNLTDVISRLTDEIASLKAQSRLNQPVYNNKDLQKMFGVSSPTLKKWRDEGYLGYSQINSVYEYSPEDISKFLANTHEQYSGCFFQ